MYKIMRDIKKRECLDKEYGHKRCVDDISFKAIEDAIAYNRYRNNNKG